MGVAHIATRMAPPGGRILVLCGPGNNGGDGYGAARFLRSWGYEIEALTCAKTPPAAGDAGLEYALHKPAPLVGTTVTIFERETPVEMIPPVWPDVPVGDALRRKPDLVIDALFGVGLSRRLEGPYGDWIEAVNAHRAPCLAVDVPSGIDADTGAPLPVCVRADVTATMAAPKQGLLENLEAAGQVVEVDIGLPRSLHELYLAPTA